MSNAIYGAKPVIGPTGELLTIDDLPPRTLKRWITRRKAEVVTAVRAGLIRADEVCERYDITAEEFRSWQRLLDGHGIRGLRATRLQDYRSPVSRDIEDAEHRDRQAVIVEG